MCQLRPGMGADQEATPVDEELARIDLRFFAAAEQKTSPNSSFKEARGFGSDKRNRRV